MQYSVIPILPLGLEPMEDQVAGHDIKVGRNVGLLKHSDGYVLKPIEKKVQGDCEISFYEKLQLNLNDELSVIKSFVPRYLGTMNLDIDGSVVRFLKLEDVTFGLNKPCIMDVKIGAQTWVPGASSEKQEVEENKYNVSKREFGFCIPGFQVYDITTGNFIKNGKMYGKNLNVETLPLAIREFLNYNSGLHGILLDHYIGRLQKLLDWWKTQRLVHIYASSILFLYDSEKLESIKNEESAVKINIESWAKVYMIDFAHVLDVVDEPDYNYINGLSNLLEVLSHL